MAREVQYGAGPCLPRETFTNAQAASGRAEGFFMVRFRASMTGNEFKTAVATR